MSSSQLIWLLSVSNFVGTLTFYILRIYTPNVLRACIVSTVLRMYIHGSGSPAELDFATREIP